MSTFICYVCPTGRTVADRIGNKTRHFGEFLMTREECEKDFVISHIEGFKFDWEKLDNSQTLLNHSIRKQVKPFY
jgi:hypothetical protein